ncbi:hypothetical protein [Candidatus Leptofilum sp.]|uniref:hypothetical protein n=1 Tax=Candidatus Leptofilum sp. TaxID=3241576 RepID=UPI003B599D00
MNHFTQIAEHNDEAQLSGLVDNFLLGSKSSEEWKQVREQASLVLQQHTHELRDLMTQMRTFTHQTSVKTVITAQSRMAALRWLIQSIEREIQRLDKAYRETAQVERLRQERAMLNAV